MFMSYIEGPKMDCTVNDGLYHRFLKWHLKCENILECELEMLPERRKCKQVISWSGDFGMEHYVSWSLSTEELTLDTIWEEFEEFCKPQSNDMKAWLDLLTSFWQENSLVDEWYNAVQTQVALTKYPPETAKILQQRFASKTINDNNIVLCKAVPSFKCNCVLYFFI